jgi:RNA polymerase sigma factor (sigma-70 family)
MTRTRTAQPAIDEADLARRTAAGDTAAFELLMRQHNGRLFRVARAILKSDEDAEDALQDAYLVAFRRIGEFRGDARLGTWLTRIVINQSLMRLRKHRRDRVVVSFSDPRRDDEPSEMDPVDQQAEPPSTTTLRAEIRHILERRIDELPVAFRTVFIMRDVEDMSVDETAASLSIPPATVRTRLFRARTLLRESLARDIDSATTDVFRFAGARCDRIVERVMSKIRSRQ